jgi:hypothetical protein
LKQAASLDFPGFGPHSLRRANVTWRQEVGGSSIETSKIARHASTATTEECTLVGLQRQHELTRRIQDKRAKATEIADTSKPPVSTLPATQRKRARNARTAIKGRKDIALETSKGTAAWEALRRQDQVVGCGARIEVRVGESNGHAENSHY